MDDDDELDEYELLEKFLKNNHSERAQKFKLFMEYFSEHGTRRRMMELSAKSSEDVVQLFQALIVDKATESDIDEVIQALNKREELVALIDCVTDLNENTSNSLHLSILKLSEQESHYLLYGISDNPYLSQTSLRMIKDIVIKSVDDEFPEVELSRSLAYNQNTELEILREIFAIKDLTTWQLIVKHNNVDEAMLDLFLKHKSVQARRLVADAKFCSERLQLELLKQNDKKAYEKLGRNPLISEEAVKFMLFKGEVLPTKKCVKAFLANNPEYYNLENVRLAGFKPPRKIIVPDISEGKLKSLHLKRIEEICSA